MAKKSVLKKEWLLLLASVVLTLLVALGLIRYFAPQLLGVPVDLRTVKVAKEVPPFFDNIFRPEDYTSAEFIIEDPYILRAKPMFHNEIQMGPNDILGFRNRSVPCAADVITIGDSQTYGNTAPLEENWPSSMQRLLKPPSTIVYNMACGAWGGVEYLEIFKKALYFRPKVVVVAYYTGNDSLGSFMRAYGNDAFKALRPDPDLSESDAPHVDFPPPGKECFLVKFPDGVMTTVTPKLRHASTGPGKAVDAGWEIMANTAEKIAALGQERGVKIVFILIPTKEYVYARKMDEAGFGYPPGFQDCVKDEAKRIKWFAERVGRIPGAVYVDVAKPLQQAALGSTELYPKEQNGHPLSAGYQIIAGAVAPAVQKLLPKPLSGPVAVLTGNNQYYPMYIKDGRLYGFTDPQTIDYFESLFDRPPFVSYENITRISWGGILNLEELKEILGPADAGKQGERPAAEAGARQ